jgi:hypothetical protein
MQKAHFHETFYLVSESLIDVLHLVTLDGELWSGTSYMSSIEEDGSLSPCYIKGNWGSESWRILRSALQWKLKSCPRWKAFWDKSGDGLPWSRSCPLVYRGRCQPLNAPEASGRYVSLKQTKLKLKATHSILKGEESLNWVLVIKNVLRVSCCLELWIPFFISHKQVFIDYYCLCHFFLAFLSYQIRSPERSS